MNQSSLLYVLKRGVPLLVALNTFLLLAVVLGPRQQRMSGGTVASGAACNDSMSALQEQLNAMHGLRVAYGKMYCAEHGIGPTGGFCLYGSNKTDIGGHSWMDQKLCTNLGQLFAGKSVMDFGCGRGQYGKCFEALDAGISWTGYDGSEGIFESTGGYVQFMDLAMPQYLGQQWDWVMSTEVGEHIPAKYEATVIGNIVRHAKEGVILSWAVPGQHGHHHVNPLENRVVIDLMGRHGFSFDKALTTHLRAAAQFPYFKNTLMAFNRS